MGAAVARGTKVVPQSSVVVEGSYSTWVCVPDALTKGKKSILGIRSPGTSVGGWGVRLTTDNYTIQGWRG